MSASDLIKRRDTMLQARLPHESVTRECFDYTLPERGDGFNGQQLDAQQIQNKRAKILDSTGTDAVRILASAIQAGLTPSNSRWFGMDVSHASHEEKTWLDGAAETLWENIHNANFDAAGFEGCLDLVCAGWFALYVDEDKERGGFAFELWPLSSLALGSTRTDGKIDIVHRTYYLTAEQAVKEFGDTNLSESTRKKALDAPETKVEFIHAIYPRTPHVVGAVRAKNLPIASSHVEVSARRMVKESGYHEMPVIVPRWCRLPNSVYATGPVKDALPDIKMLNELKRMEFASLDLAIAGMWIAEDDGVLNPRTVKVGPRKIIVANSVDSMKPLVSGASFNIAFSSEERLQASIRKLLMADQLQPQSGPQMTATEVHVRVDLIRQQLGPMYGRLQAEYLKPLVERCFGLAFRAGVFSDPPPSLAGREFSVTYVSPMARAQKLEDVSAMDRYELSLAAELQINPQSETADNYDRDKATRRRAQLLGVPTDLIRDEKGRDRIRAQRADEQQQAAQRQVAMGAMQTAANQTAKQAVVNR